MRKNEDMAVVYLCTGDPVLRALLAEGLKRHAPALCDTAAEAARRAAQAPGILICGAENWTGAAARAAAEARLPAIVIASRRDDMPSPPPGISVLQQPFRMGALLDRIAAYKTAGARKRPPVHIGPYTLDPDDNVLADETRGFTVRLTEKERDILLRLHAAQSAVVDRDTLLGDIWGYGSNIETHTLETHIYRLRRKIESDPAQPLLLTTEEGKGYRLRPSGENLEA